MSGVLFHKQNNVTSAIGTSKWHVMCNFDRRPHGLGSRHSFRHCAKPSPRPSSQEAAATDSFSSHGKSGGRRRGYNSNVLMTALAISHLCKADSIMENYAMKELSASP